jgi:transposase
MTKPVSTTKKPRKQHTPEFRDEAQRIGMTAAARQLSLYESQLYAWRSKQQQQMTSSEREMFLPGFVIQFFAHQRDASPERNKRYGELRGKYAFSPTNFEHRLPHVHCFDINRISRCPE